MNDKRSIRLKEYEPMLRVELGDDVVDKLMLLLDNYLPCSTCKKVLPVTEFSTCRVNRNRMGHYADCRKCSREKYEYMKQYNL